MFTFPNIFYPLSPPIPPSHIFFFYGFPWPNLPYSEKGFMFEPRFENICEIFSGMPWTQTGSFYLLLLDKDHTIKEV